MAAWKDQGREGATKVQALTGGENCFLGGLPLGLRYFFPDNSGIFRVAKTIKSDGFMRRHNTMC